MSGNCLCSVNRSMFSDTFVECVCENSSIELFNFKLNKLLPLPEAPAQDSTRWMGELTAFIGKLGEFKRLNDEVYLWARWGKCICFLHLKQRLPERKLSYTNLSCMEVLMVHETHFCLMQKWGLVWFHLFIIYRFFRPTQEFSIFHPLVWQFSFFSFVQLSCGYLFVISAFSMPWCCPINSPSATETVCFSFCITNGGKAGNCVSSW